MEAETGLVGQKKTAKKVDVFLGFCRLLGFLTIISSLLCMTAHGMAFVVGPPVLQDLTALLEQSLRAYGIVISLFLVAVESDWQLFMSQIRLMDSWVVRSLFQMFLTVLTLYIAVSDGDDDYHKSLQLYRKISAVSLLGCASIYLCGGFMCLGYLKQSRMKKMIEQGKIHESLQKLEMQEKELRKALARYSSV